jgi:hypothetical protein
MEVPCVLLTVPSWIIAPFWYLIIVLVGVEQLIPRLWILIEEIWWRLVLGNSPTGRLLRGYAMEDFQLSIRQRVVDGALPRQLAVLLAIAARPFELRRLTADLKGSKAEMSVETFESAIEQLNKLWREGTMPQILHSYIKDIESSIGDAAIDVRTRLRGRCAIAIVKYALGDIRGGNELGRRNWEEAKRLEPEEESLLKWLASYGFFNSTLFLGNHRLAMNLMAKQWSKYYAPLTASQRGSLREQLSGKLILNPILAIPRHIILAAAFEETPVFDEEFWPSATVYRSLSAGEHQCKIKWVQAWYDEAKRICRAEPTSLDFSHAYTGFYLTMLLLEPGMPSAHLHRRIDEAFNQIDDSAAIVAQYVKYGFSGVYHLVCGENEKALDCLSQAASFSAISGNRFADCIFMCSHAVAAARLSRPGRYMEPDIKCYLSEAEKLARSINCDFYKKLCDAAYAAVCLQRGDKAKAQRYAERSKRGRAGNRILGIFESGVLEPRAVAARANALHLLRAR